MGGKTSNTSHRALSDGLCILTGFVLDEGGGCFEHVSVELWQIHRLLYHLLRAVLAFKQRAGHILCGREQQSIF